MNRPKNLLRHLSPSPGLIESIFAPRASDGSPLEISQDTKRNAVIVHGTSASGLDNRFEVTGEWPNQQATFNSEGDVYLFAWTSLQRLPRLAIGWDFLFSYGLRGENTELVYEVVLPVSGPKGPQDLRPFAASRATIGGNGEHHINAAARGYWTNGSNSFAFLVGIDPGALEHASPFTLFQTHPIGPPPDLSPCTNIPDALKKASFFTPVFPPSPLVPYKLTVTRYLLHMLGWCVGGAVAGGGGGAVGGGAVGAAFGAAFGCLGGAIASGVVDIVDLLTDPTEVGAGGGGGAGAVGAAGGGAGNGGSSSPEETKK